MDVPYVLHHGLRPMFMQQSQHSHFRATALLAASLAVGCTDVSAPGSRHAVPTVPPAQGSISDAVHGGNPGFFFLAPLVKTPAFAGAFDPEVPVTVEICEVAAGDCARRVASFSSRPDSTMGGVSVSVVDEHYSLLWRTGEGGTRAGSGYRIAVLTRGMKLGHADVVLEAGGDAAKKPGAADIIPLVHGRAIPVRFRIEEGAAPVVRAPVGETGGRLQLAGYATLDVPPAALDGVRDVSLSATALPEVDADFRETVLSPTLQRSPWELRVTAGVVPPVDAMTVSVEIPAEFESALPPGQRPALWVQQYQDEGEDLLDGFLPLPATRSGGQLVASLPPDAFTDRRNGDAVHEAIVVLGAVAAAGPSAMVSSRAVAASVDGVGGSAECRGSPLGSTKESGLTVTSPFGGRHKGVDYRSANGERLLAPVSGVIERIGWDVRHLTEPDPRTGLMVKGWGRYVLIRLADGTSVLMAHLIESSTAHLAVGMQVTAGDFIGLSDNTGGSTGPHLHIEHRLADNTPVDPDACLVREPADFSGRWTGSLAGDNGRISISGDWTWEILQTGASVTGRTSIGPLSGTVAGNVLTMTVNYLGVAGATFKGSVTLSGNTISGAMLLDIIAETIPITTTMTRASMPTTASIPGFSIAPELRATVRPSVAPSRASRIRERARR